MWILSHTTDCSTDAHLFCRLVAPQRQLLACSMSLSADHDVSMVLPLPVPAGCPADVIRFVDLEDYPAFFGRMDSGFARQSAQTCFEVIRERVRRPESPLQIHVRADYTTTALLNCHDLERLDPPVRVPKGLWERFPDYRDFGFVVLRIHGPRTRAALAADVRAARDRLLPLIDQLSHPLARIYISGSSGAEEAAIDVVRAFHRHVDYLADDVCMRPGFRDIAWFALTFPHREPETLSFPPVQVLGSQAHSEVAVDAWLYCQAEPFMEGRLFGWEVSESPAGAFIPPSEIVDSRKAIYRKRLEGRHRKDEIVVSGGGP